MKNNDRITRQLLPLITKIRHHSLYDSIFSISHLRIFMEHHVFAVWDFMCLLKELHKRIVCTQAPWFPPKDAYSANLINQILVEEEGDLTEDGQHYLSHFELYLAAMHQIDADTQPIQNLLCMLADNMPLNQAVEKLSLPLGVRDFVQTTFSFFAEDTPSLAAAFVYGREAITAPLFKPLLQRITENLTPQEKSQTKLFGYYLQRHIQLDQDDHLPKALQMLNRLTPDTPVAWQKVESAALRALQARLAFLSQIQIAINLQDNLMSG